MRVLIGMPESGTRSGPNACEPPFVDALRALGVDVLEVTFVFGDNLEAAGVAARIRRVVGAARNLRRVAAANEVDVVHLNTSFDPKTVLRDAFTLTLLGRSTAPVFLKLHGSDASLVTHGPAPLRLLARYVLRRAAAIGVLSSAERDSFVSAGVPASKIHLVRNALPTPHVAPSLDRFLAQHDLPDGVPRLVFISRLIPTKGLIDTIRAASVLRDRGMRFVLICVGDGPERPKAEEEVRLLGLEQHVRFLGYLREAEAAGFYQHCDLLVFPTFHDEGLPIVLLNALAAGLPIVTTRTRAAVDYLSEPETCLWVKPRVPVDIASRMAELIGDDALRAAMADRGREQALLFQPAVVASLYKDLYETLTGGASAPAVERSQPTVIDGRLSRDSKVSR
jgi:glycosyltransferase involved in cell wall biosynthesis